MAEQENTKNDRPKCQYREDFSKPRCGSEDRIYEVTGKSRTYGQTTKTPVCGKHLTDAWKKWNVDDARPMCPSTK